LLSDSKLRAGKIRSLSGAEAQDFSEHSSKFLRPSTPLREQKFVPSDTAQGKPSAALRARKIRSLSGAEAPDFQKQCAKFLRPSAPLREQKFTPSVTAQGKPKRGFSGKGCKFFHP